jgi:hypothetical protein
MHCIFTSHLYKRPGEFITNQQQSANISELYLPCMSSPLLRNDDENIRHAHCSMPHIFLEKYLGENLEKGSLKT